MKLSESQAHYVLNALVLDGKVRAAQVRNVLKNREREIRSLRERLAALEKLSLAGASGSRGARAARRSAGGRVRARRVRMSPRVRALRRLQGKYMGYVRRLKPADKNRVRGVREKQGMNAAIRLAKSLAGKS
jgi:cytochrome c-type biogenesis protein CcmH/NrfG